MLIVTVLVYNRTDIHDEEHRLTTMFIVLNDKKQAFHFFESVFKYIAAYHF